MTPMRRWLVLIALLVATVAFIVFDRQYSQSPAIVDAALPRPKAQAAADAAAVTPQEQADGSMILPIRSRSAAATIDDAFATRDWRPPPPPPPKVAAQAPVMVAPALPYTVIGKKLEDGAWQVFLRRDERILVVKTSDTIDDAYRVDDIRPPVMTITYLPLQQRQTLPIGGAE